MQKMPFLSTTDTFWKEENYVLTGMLELSARIICEPHQLRGLHAPHAVIETLMIVEIALLHRLGILTMSIVN
jgi:hypothetical protein